MYTPSFWGARVASLIITPIFWEFFSNWLPYSFLLFLYPLLLMLLITSLSSSSSSLLYFWTLPYAPPYFWTLPSSLPSSHHAPSYSLTLPISLLYFLTLLPTLHSYWLPSSPSPWLLTSFLLTFFLFYFWLLDYPTIYLVWWYSFLWSFFWVWEGWIYIGVEEMPIWEKGVKFWGEIWGGIFGID